MRTRRYSWLLLLVVVALWVQWEAIRKQDSQILEIAEVQQERPKSPIDRKEPRTNFLERTEALRYYRVEYLGC